jgi:hypothetical protein
MPLVVALVDQCIALILLELSEHLKAVRVASNQSSAREQARVLWHAVAFGKGLRLLGCGALGQTLERVVDNVAGDRLAAGTHIA